MKTYIQKNGERSRPRLLFGAPSRRTYGTQFILLRSEADDEGLVGCARGGRGPHSI